jgi:bifunctional DNase/RNase
MERQVIPIGVKGVMPTSNGCAVFLGTTEKTFVIYVDSSIGAAISRAINGEQLERPQTHDLIKTMLDGFEASVDRILINDVQENTFFARIIFKMQNELGSKIVEIDARPSDSIVLALLFGSPIFVCETVFERVDDMTEILERILKQEE